MKIIEALAYLMAVIGVITTGFTLAAYWMIWQSARHPKGGSGE